MSRYIGLAMRPQMIIPAVACLLLASIGTVCRAVDDAVAADSPFAVDYSQPTYIKRLRSMNKADTEARTPIQGYVEGALLMHQKFFSDDINKRCSAYAHLFKLLAKYPSQSATRGAKIVRQETVVALNKLVATDSAEYADLLSKYQVDTLGDLFKAAIEGFERIQDKSDLQNAVYVELYDCAEKHSSLMNINSFVKAGFRTKAIGALKSKMPKGNSAGSNESGTSSKFNDKEIEEARAKVEQFDDEKLAELRAKFRAPKIKDPETLEKISFCESVKKRVRGLDDATLTESEKPEKMEISVLTKWVKTWGELEEISNSNGGPDSALVREYLASNADIHERLNTIVARYRHIQTSLAQKNLDQKLNSLKSRGITAPVLKNILELVDDVNVGLAARVLGNN